jgi:hypothetical protein
MFKAIILKFKVFGMIFKALWLTAKCGKDTNKNISKAEHLVNMKSTLSTMQVESNKSHLRKILEIRLDRDKELELLRIRTLKKLNATVA